MVFNQKIKDDIGKDSRNYIEYLNGTVGKNGK
jgi:hypothetical protein